VTLVYAALRTVVAVALVVAAGLGGGRAWPLVGQAVSDVACLVFMIAYVDVDLRASLGWLVAPLFLYVLAWEARAVAGAASTLLDSDAVSDGLVSEILKAVGGVWGLSYRALFVTPPVAAGALLMLAWLYPGAWAFSDMPAPLRCLPETVARGDTVTLRMSGPHGGELGVFTPANKFLYIVDLAPNTAPPGERFEYRDRFFLATDRATGRVLEGAPPGSHEVRIFADTGTYLFRVSEAAEIAASITCKVRYTHALPNDH
jgi:hypothetical protein